MSKIKIVYVTSSDFKVVENEAFLRSYEIEKGKLAGSMFEFEIRRVQIKEVLEIDLVTMVLAEVTAAYSQIKVPCIVEHAGLVFDGHSTYPGGLTKPMWNSLGDKFIEETHSAGRKAIARAVVAYCDGKSAHTFVGETRGSIADRARGSRQFYWDTVFIPDKSEGAPGDKSYAELVDDSSFGLHFKMSKLSQSAKAMAEFLRFRIHRPPELWPRS